MQEILGTHFVGRITQKAIIVEGKKVLLTRGILDGELWELPGGSLHIDENPKEGLRREIKEELGVDAEIGRVVYTEQFTQTNDGSSRFLVAYETTLKEPESNFKFDDEVAETLWITREDLQKVKIYKNIRNALEVYFSSI